MAHSALERFTLRDNNGVFLTNPGDELTIYEPIGFSSFLRNVERDSEYFGFNAEYGEAESELGFDHNKVTGQTYNPFEMLSSILTNTGVDANISLRYYRTSGGTETLQYEWWLIFKSGDEQDDKISFRVKKTDFDDKLRTRFDTDVDVESTTDLDDNSNSALSLESLPLYSRKTQRRVNANADVEGTNLASFSIDSTSASFQGTPGYPIQTINELGYTDSTSIVLIGANNVASSTTPAQDQIDTTSYNILVTEKGTYAIDITLSAGFTSIVDLSGQSFDWVLDFYLLILDSSKNIKTKQSLYSDSGASDTNDVISTVSINYDNEYELEEGDTIFVYFQYESLVIGAFPFDQSILFSIGSGIFQVNALTTFQPSTTEGGFIFDVLNKAIEKIVGNTTPATLTLSSISGAFTIGETVYTDVNIGIITSDTFTPWQTVTTPTFEGVVKTFTYSGIGAFYGMTIRPISGQLSGGQTITESPSGSSGSLFPISNGDYFTGTVISWSSPTLVISLVSRSVINGATVIGLSSSASGDIDSSSIESVLESTFLSRTENGSASDGYGSLNFITSGKKIRGLTENANLRIQAGKILDFLRARYSCGWMIVNDGGINKVVVEKSWYFFQQVKILTLYNVEEPVRRRISTDFLFNEVKAGYSKYAKENENNSIDGFNTERDYLLPIEKEKRKFQLVAPVVTDGAEIERVRRLNIKKDESDQSDDETILIKCIRFNSSNMISISDYGVGDVSVIINDSENTVTISGMYLEGVLGSVSTIDLVSISQTAFGTTYSETITIDSVTYDKEDNQTIFTVSSAITTPDATYNFGLFYFDIDVIIPERNESFLSLSGVNDIYSEYNIDHAPSNFLIQWWHLLGSSVSQKGGTKKVKFTRGVNNASLSKRYNSSDGPLTTSQITENQDFLISSLNVYNTPIITAFEWELTCYISYEDFQIIRLALLGQNTDSPSLNFGYLEFTDNFGNLVNIYPKSMKREEKTGKTDIIGWERETGTPPPPPTFRILQEQGTDFISTEKDDNILQENF